MLVHFDLQLSLFEMQGHQKKKQKKKQKCTEWPLIDIGHLTVKGTVYTRC